MFTIKVGNIIQSICIMQTNGDFEGASWLYSEVFDDGTVDTQDWPEDKNYLALKKFFVGWNIEEVYNYEDDEIYDIISSTPKKCKKIEGFDFSNLITNPNTKSLSNIKNNIGKAIEELFKNAKTTGQDCSDIFHSNPNAKPLDYWIQERRFLDIDGNDEDII